MELKQLVKVREISNPESLVGHPLLTGFSVSSRLLEFSCQLPVSEVEEFCECRSLEVEAVICCRDRVQNVFFGSLPDAKHALNVWCEEAGIDSATLRLTPGRDIRDMECYLVIPALKEVDTNSYIQNKS